MKKITEKSNSKLINGQKLTKVMAITGLTLSMASSISVIPTQTVHAEDSTTIQSNDNDLGNGLVLKDGILHITKHVAIEGNIFDTVKGHKKDEVKSISIEAPMILAQNSHDTFSGFKNVKSITGLENLNLHHTYSLDNMFANDTSLTDIDVSKMDVSHVQSMKYMFANTKISNLDLSTWQAPRVITIGMLSNTPISVISLSNNISIQGSELSTELKGYKNAWKIVGNGTIDKPQYDKEYSSKDIEDRHSVSQNIGQAAKYTRQKIDNVLPQVDGTNLGNGLVLKDGVLHITKHVAIEGNIFDSVKDHKKDEVKSIKIEAPMTLAQNSHDTFSGFKNVKCITGLENLNLQYAYSLDNMFANDTSLTDIDVSKMDVSHVQSMKYMFANTKISNLDLSTWQAPRVITIGMLSNTPITVISLSNNISIQGSELSTELKGYKNT